jgi:hypothetical protein
VLFGEVDAAANRYSFDQVAALARGPQPASSPI